MCARGRRREWYPTCVQAGPAPRDRVDFRGRPAVGYSALWPRNASNGSITLHQDQYAATVSFKTASTTEREPKIQNPAVSTECSGSQLMPPDAHSISAGRLAALDTVRCS